MCFTFYENHVSIGSTNVAYACVRAYVSLVIHALFVRKTSCARRKISNDVRRATRRKRNTGGSKRLTCRRTAERFDRRRRTRVSVSGEPLPANGRARKCFDSCRGRMQMARYKNHTAGGFGPCWRTEIRQDFRTFPVFTLPQTCPIPNSTRSRTKYTGRLAHGSRRPRRFFSRPTIPCAVCRQLFFVLSAPRRINR